MSDHHLPFTTDGRIRLTSLKSNVDEVLLEELNTPMALLSPQTLKEWERMKKSAHARSAKELDCE
jgi:hypothetical protein